MRVNENIRDKQVKLINEEGKMQGVVEIKEALLAARSKQMDLVEIIPGQTISTTCQRLTALITW